MNPYVGTVAVMALVAGGGVALIGVASLLPKHTVSVVTDLVAGGLVIWFLPMLLTPILVTVIAAYRFVRRFRERAVEESPLATAYAHPVTVREPETVDESRHEQRRRLRGAPIEEMKQ